MAEAGMTRWAMIMTNDRGLEEVISLQLREKGSRGPDLARLPGYSAEPVSDDVFAGMIRGGEFGKVAGGFGWETDPEAKGRKMRADADAEAAERRKALA